MATHSSILAQEIPWSEEPGRVQSMGSWKSWKRLSDHRARTLLLASWKLFYERDNWDVTCRITLSKDAWHDIAISSIYMFLVLLPGKSHGRRSLVGCSPWGREESDTTERLHFHFLFSCIGEGNGNPLQCSCLENSRDGGAWWAAVYGVTQSWTRLKRLSSSSSLP